MAARKKASPSKGVEKFVVLWSECGDDGQLELLPAGHKDKNIFPTMGAAKEAANQDAAGDLTGRFCIAKIVAEGRTGSDINWK